MKSIVTFILTCFCGMPCAFAQDSAKAAPKPRNEVQPGDNHTIQRLIIFNQQQEILLEKGRNGWMTPALRSNKKQTLKQGLDSLAKAIGIVVEIKRLAGIFTYKWTDLDDVSYRTHYTAKHISGNTVQAASSDQKYQWFPIKEALNSISFDALKAETRQIITYPKTLWGGAFLCTANDGKFSCVIEEAFYPLDKK